MDLALKAKSNGIFGANGRFRLHKRDSFELIGEVHKICQIRSLCRGSVLSEAPLLCSLIILYLIVTLSHTTFVL